MSDEYLSAAFGRKQSLDATLSNMLGEKDDYSGQRSTSGTKNVPCSACGKMITSTTGIRAQDKIYHRECFKCSNCNKVISGSSFSLSQQGKLLCNFCDEYDPQKKANLCKGCGNVISSYGVQFQGAKYHRDCFKCAACNQPFTTKKIALIQGKPVCEKCVQSGKKPQVTKSPELGLEDLEKLAQLRDKGIISQQEFEKKKQQILGI